jgi:hypothetical protein
MVPLLARLRRAFRSCPPPLRLAAAIVLLAAASVAYQGLRSRAGTGVVGTQSGPGPASAGGDDASAEGDAIARPVNQAFDAAGRGDLERYLEQFADPLRSQLARTRAEKGEAYLRDYLARLAGPVKGVAVRLSEKQELGPDSVRVPVELVYQDRNEVQTFHLQRGEEGPSASWRIRRIDAARAAPTLIPYGTPVEQVR